MPAVHAWLRGSLAYSSILFCTELTLLKACMFHHRVMNSSNFSSFLTFDCAFLIIENAVWQAHCPTS